MQAIIHQWAFNGSFDQLASLPRQELVNDWFGYDVEPSAEFAFATDGQYLWFLAARNRDATGIRTPGPASFSRNCGGMTWPNGSLPPARGPITGNPTSPSTARGGPALYRRAPRE
ncbi:MAG: hypothetical protein ACLU7D_09735 [Collinsella sp.]